MKKRKSMLGMALIIAILMLGIGYAALQITNLPVDGSVKTTKNDANFKVSYDTTKSVTFSRENVATGSVEENKATLNVTGLVVAGDTVTATYTIHNESTDLAATIAAGTPIVTDKETSQASQYFEVTSAVTNPTLAAQTSTTLTVTVTLKKTPINDVEATIEVPFTATAVEKAGA